MMNKPKIKFRTSQPQRVGDDAEIYCGDSNEIIRVRYLFDSGADCFILSEINGTRVWRWEIAED